MTSLQKKKDATPPGQPFGWLRGNDPFSQLKEEMDDLFSSYIPALPALGRSNGGRMLAMPTKLDVSETDEAIELVLDVPGIDKKGVLSVTLPKSETARQTAKKITIKAD